jgi:hypothetical protein
VSCHNLSNIKVAEGGRAAFRCIVAGKAELSGVSASVLTDKQRATLEKAYAAYNQVLDLAYENAGAIAETYNTFTEKLAGIQKKATDLASKLNGGGKASKAEVEALKQLTEQATAQMQTTLDAMKKAYGEQINKEMAAQLETIINQNKAKTAELSNFKADNPTAIAGAVQSLASTKPAETEKIIKALPPLMVEYAGKPYGDKKEIAMVNNSNQLKIKNLEETEGYSWKLSDGISGSSNTLNISFPTDKPTLTLEVTQGNRKMSVVVRKKSIKFDGIIVVDGRNSKRFADSRLNEVLYLVGGGEPISYDARQLNFKMIPKPQKDDFPSGEPYFFTTSKSLDGNTYFEDDLTWRSTGCCYSKEYAFSRTYPPKWSSWANASIGAFGKTYDVDIKFVKGDVRKVGFAEKISSVLTQINSVSTMFGQIQKYMPCKFEVAKDPNKSELDISLSSYNEEDEKSRHIYDIREYAFKLNKKDLFTAKCGLPITPFGVYIGDLYAGFSIDAGIYINPKFKINYETKVQKIEGKGGGSVSIKPKIGFEKKIVKDKFEFDINANITAGVKVEYPYKMDYKNIALFPYLDRSMIDAKATIDLPILGKKDWKYSFMLFDTRWQLDPPLNLLKNIFD